jgi:hypothetical protein
MIDIETFSTRNNACILTIGAVRFDRNREVPVSTLDTFYRRITLRSCEEMGMHIDQKTIDWWKSQSEEAKLEVFDTENRVPIKEALTDLAVWLNGRNFIWSHGASFDVVILADAYTRCGLTIPWKFFDVRDTRTIYHIGGVTSNDLSFTKHHAVDDCLRQIVGVWKAVKKIGAF